VSAAGKATSAITALAGDVDDDEVVAGDGAQADGVGG
jgi:hypothetical protein